jgi:hypothetical protein
MGFVAVTAICPLDINVAQVVIIRRENIPNNKIVRLLTFLHFFYL